MSARAHAEQDQALDDLLRDSGAPVTARRRWWSVWERAFGFDAMMIRLDDDNAVAPLATRSVRGRTEVRILGGESADHARLPAREGRSARQLADVVAARLSDLSEPWRLRFDHLPPGDPVAQRLAEVLPGSRWHLAPDRASPFVVLRPGTEIEDYLRRMSRKEHRRTAREFARASGTVRHVQDPERITTLLPALARIRRDRDHRVGRVSDLDSHRGYAFWEAVITEHARSGELEVSLAEVEGQLIGYTVTLLDDTTERLWDGRVAPQGEQLSVGRLLEDTALELAVRRGATELDLMRGVSRSKMRLATDVRACSTLEAWSHNSDRRTQLATRAAVDWAKKVRDSHEALDNLWRATKRRTLLREP